MVFLTSFNLLIDRTLKFILKRHMDWSSPKVKGGVKNRFVDFFAVVPKSLSEVNYKSINGSFPFGSGSN